MDTIEAPAETSELLQEMSEREVAQQTPPTRKKRWMTYAALLIALVGAAGVFNMSKSGRIPKLDFGALISRAFSGPATADRIVDVLFDDTTIPKDGTTFCVYSPLPTDDVYQAVEFTFTPSKLPNIGIVMMFTISDHAVANLKAEGYNLKDEGVSVLPCDDGAPLMISQWSGGYLLMQQAPSANYHPEPMPSDWGMLVGKGTARKHVLIRWQYREGVLTEDAQDAGAGFHIHLLRGTPRPISFGEAKFAIAQTMPADASIRIPAGEAAWPIFGQCTSQGVKDVFKGSGVEILTGHAFGGWVSGFRLLESVGGGEFEEKKREVDKYESCRFPHYANQLLEEGDFKELWSMPTADIGKFVASPVKTVIKPGNSYRFECIFDTTSSTEEVIGGSEANSANCQYQFYYREIPGDNEPFPGFCMDVGQWFLRSPKLEEGEVEKQFNKWKRNPAAQAMDSKMHKCPSKDAHYAEDPDISAKFGWDWNIRHGQ